MRARLAIVSAGVTVELREVLLRDKPEAFLQTSPTGTVPALRLHDQVLDESLDIMKWALKNDDPRQLLDMPESGHELIATFDGPFKDALDHTKYATRYPELDAQAERHKASEYLLDLNAGLKDRMWLYGDRPTLADLALLPFIRQFAFIDRVWFDQQPWPHLIAWLDRFLDSEEFGAIMTKYAPWAEGEKPTLFGT